MSLSLGIDEEKNETFYLFEIEADESREQQVDILYKAKRSERKRRYLSSTTDDHHDIRSKDIKQER